MASKDGKYFVVKRLIEGGDITLFYQIFNHIAKTKVSKDLGMHYDRLRNLIKSEHLWVLNDLFRLAQMIDVDEETMLRLIINQRAERKLKKTRKKD